MKKTNGQPDSSIFDLDLTNLEIKWKEQAALMFEYTQELADARQGHSEAVRSLAVREAEVAQDVRLHPDKYGLEKVTEASVKEVIVLRTQVQEKNVIEMKHRVDVLWGYVESLGDRRKALENLVQLFGMGYFAEPKTQSEKAFRPLSKK